VACNDGVGTTENHYWRAFDMATFTGGQEYDVTSVSFGIESATSGTGTGQPLTVNLYANHGSPFPGGDWQSNLIATSGPVNIPDQALTIFNQAISATVAAGTLELVMEVTTPDGTAVGNLFFIGSNADPETGPSYLSAVDCGVPNPTPVGDIGFPNMHIVFNVNGSCPGGGACTNYTFTSGTDTIVPGDTDIGNHTDDGDTFVALPFSFQLYDQTFNGVNVSSNGRLDFVCINEPGGFLSGCIPPPDNICPFDYTIFPDWTDLRTDIGLSGCASFPGGNCGVFTSVSGSAPNRIFNIEWRAVYFNDNTQTANFEARIYESDPNHRFDFVFGDIQPGSDQLYVSGVEQNASVFTQDFCDTNPPAAGSRTYTCGGGPTPSPTPSPTCTPGGGGGLLIGSGMTTGFLPNGWEPTLAGNTVNYTFSNSQTAPNEFALFDTHDPWGFTVIKDAITSNGHTYTEFTPAQLAGFNFADYRVIILNWDDSASSDFVADYTAAIPALEAYINAGGVVWVTAAIQSCDSIPMPFGGQGNGCDFGDNDPVVDPANPMMVGMPNPIPGTSASHLSFSSLPGTAHIVVNSNASGQPALYELFPGGGGCTPTPSPTPSCTPSGGWLEVAPYPFAARGPFVVSDGTSYYVGGGYDGTNVHNELFLYDPVANTYTPLANAPDPFFLSQAVIFNNKIYSIAGFNLGGQSNTTRIYDIAGNSWTTATALPEAAGLSDAATGLDNGKIYIAGGFNGSGAINTLHIYDIATDSWTTGAPMPTALYLPGFGVINGKLYVASGNNGSTEVPDLQIYDIATDTWTTGAPIPTPVTAPGSAVFNGKLYVFGGTAPFPVTTTITQIYDPATNSWSAGPAMVAGKLWFYGGALDDSSILAPGGDDASIFPTNDVQMLGGGGGGGCTPTPTPSCTPIIVNGAIDGGDPTQTDRLFRDGIPSTCDAPKACPGPFGDGLQHHYDSYTFTNTTGSTQCVSVDANTSCVGTNYIFLAAYLGSFDPTNLCANYLADQGSSPDPSAPPGPFSFDLADGQSVVIVVSEVTADAGCPGYTVTVEGLCGGGGTPTPTPSPPSPTPTATATATATLPPVSPTPTPTATATATATTPPASPTPTATATATTTPRPTPTPRPRPTPYPRPTP
jgi:hypothetical protein